MEAPERREYVDIAYARDSARQKLDLLLPAEGDGPFPVIVYVHGGAYFSGSKADQIAGLRKLANDRGYAVVPVGYRLLDDAPFPAQIRDLKAAVRWLRAHADEYALDRSRIVVWGVSAGGHLAALLATSGGDERLEGGELGNATQSSEVSAAVDWFGPADFKEVRRHIERNPASWARQLDYMTDVLEQTPGMVALANPATHADPTDPPIFIQHGDADDVVPLGQSEQLASQLTSVLGAQKVRFEVFEGEGHGGPAFVARDNLERVLDWLDSALDRP